MLFVCDKMPKVRRKNLYLIHSRNFDRVYSKNATAAI